jgi:hypothetical protein
VAIATISGRVGQMGRADFVVVLSEGAYAAGSIAFGFNGQSPVLRHACLIVSVVNTVSRAFA